MLKLNSETRIWAILETKVRDIFKFRIERIELVHGTFSSLILRFQNGPYACHTVKFQHIEKSRIVDSDIDSLDSVVGLI